MFNTHVFKSWPTILAGAFLFACLFALLGGMSELVLDGTMYVSRKVMSLGLLAFVGYVAVALMLRTRN